MPSVNITIAQLAPYIANPSKNLEKISKAIKKASKENSDLIIFPELFLHGYYSKDLIYRLAETKDGKNIKQLIKLSSENNISIITGFIERDEQYEVLYNSAIYITPDGDVEVYRKRHLPDFSVFNEARYFRRSQGKIKLWSIKGFRFGMMICFDLFYPELSRAYTYLGAKGLITISATPDFSRPLFHVLLTARAIENTVFTIWVNMVGTFNGVGFAGGSRVVEPLGQVLYDGPLIEEDLKTVTIDLNAIKVAREKRPVLRELSTADLEILTKSYHLDI